MPRTVVLFIVLTLGKFSSSVIILSFQVFELTLSIIGCVVNGPGESKHADIGISLPGNGEAPVAPVFIDGQRAKFLSGSSIAKDFIGLVDDYVDSKFGSN